MDNFKRNLLLINEEIKKYQGKDIFTACVAERLDKSLNMYEKNLLQTCDYLIQRSPVAILKFISKKGKT